MTTDTSGLTRPEVSPASSPASPGMMRSARVSGYFSRFGDDIGDVIKSLSDAEQQQLKKNAKEFALQALKNLKIKLSGEEGEEILQDMADSDFAGDKTSALKKLRETVVSGAVNKYIRHFVDKKMRKAHSLSADGSRLNEEPVPLPPASSPRPKSPPVQTTPPDDAVEFRPGCAKGEVVIEGFLTKLATRQFAKPGGGDKKSHTNWKKRYFRLVQTPTNVLLLYYVDGSLQDMKGEFVFTPGLVVKLCPASYYPKKQHVFQVTDGNGPRCIVKFIGFGADAKTSEKWCSTIRSCIEKLPKIVRVEEDY